MPWREGKNEDEEERAMKKVGLSTLFRSSLKIKRFCSAQHCFGVVEFVK